MRSLAETTIRWEATFNHNLSLSDLKGAVRKNAQDNPCHAGLRSICWKAFLLFENLDRSTWPKRLQDSRSAYTSLKEHFLRDIENPDDLSATDPLADDERSPWNTLRRDEILRGEIFQDVERCMPENLYFREPTTQAALLDVLFIYCKLNADIGYRQGMHEVLAPVLWVVSRDAIDHNTLNVSTGPSALGNELVSTALDFAYVEHDAFSIFCAIMQTAKSFYELGSNTQQPSLTSPLSSPIVERSKRIHENYLRKTDPELAEHLTAIDILPQIFVIRWIRLLFGREFPFDDVLNLWDVLFAEDPGLDLVDYVCLAMLLRVRWQLLEADYSSALTLLLRYPVPAEPHGPSSFVDDALYLRRNLTLNGGVHIVNKYSGKSHILQPRGKPTLSPRRSGNHRRSAESEDFSIFQSPLRSSAQFLQEQGGIEGLLQEAAKGVYSRSEKWGVSKALRGAVQGLQSGNNSPRRPVSGVRWSLDDGKIVSTDVDNLTERIQALEQRNKLLAKTLQNAMDDLSVQQSKLENEEARPAADALTLAIARLQFVQVYLEDSSIPIASESTDLAHGQHVKDLSASPLHKDGPIVNVNISQPIPAAIQSPTKSMPGIKKQSQQTSKKSPISDTTQSSNIQPMPASPTSPTVSPAPVVNVSKESSPRGKLPPPSFQRPRPSLASSSFSWMLGEGQEKSSFVSATPFEPEQRRGSVARGDKGYLFGEDKVNGKDKGKEKGKDEEDDGFTMGTLKGLPKEEEVTN